MDSERTKLLKGDNFEHTYEGPLSLDGRWEKCEVRMQKVEERGERGEGVGGQSYLSDTC